jgi:hypothetical protein
MATGSCQKLFSESRKFREIRMKIFRRFM